jgi:hypothetical protein
MIFFKIVSSDHLILLLPNILNYLMNVIQETRRQH